MLNDIKILHAAKRIIDCEKEINNQVDILLDCFGLTRESVGKVIEKAKEEQDAD